MRSFLLAWHPPTLGEDDCLYGPTSLATPISLPVLGSYDAYGAVDNIVEGPLERRLLSHAQELHARGDLALKGAPFPDDVEGLLRHAARGEVTAKVLPAKGGLARPREPHHLALSLMFVDARVYDAVIALVRESQDWEAEWRVGGPRGPADGRAAMAKICERNGNVAFYALASDVTTDLLERMAQLHDFELALRLLRRSYAPPTGAGWRLAGRRRAPPSCPGPRKG